MAISRFSRRVLGMVGLGVALPAALLAGLGIYLTLRISDAVHAQSLRYNLYIAEQVASCFEQELLSSLEHGLRTADIAARNGEGPAAILKALDDGRAELGPPAFVPVEDLSTYDMLLVEHQPLVFGPSPDPPAGRWFAGLLLHDADGRLLGSGGWWLDSGRFLTTRLRSVFEDRLPQDARMYGGIESTRGLSVSLVGPDGRQSALSRDPGYDRTAYTEPLSGPFTGYAVRVAAISSAAVVWADRFVAFLVLFIAMIGVVLIGATFFGLRYTVRQVELAQIKSSFVSNVSHELKTPIALIRLAVETLELRRLSSPEEGEKFLRSISREAMRLNQLVDNILDFARLEAGKKVFRFASVNLLEVVADAVESFRPRLEDQQFRFEVDLPADLPPVRGDATALSQCVLNLLDNAMKYSRTRREVRVTAAARRDETGTPQAVTVSVADRGIGISPRDQKSIFEKFVRIETGLVHDVKGAGLGLSLVDQIMRAHGGRIELKSAVGEGSTFTLVLPAVRGVEAAPPEPQEQVAS
ncbi:MAG: HAMP domain-containing histidine kinase [Candidatus Eisenbacteria bacterium]|uniref:histidine kinase n=1 Tax=Eiseniibacteriota bacterium TaxID=2212470 RepID=A0A538UDS5_UNCEI|nr:MAG: HAMP domain-containing histidine kinase [Candidatus Eisenbacteria bacterium]